MSSLGFSLHVLKSTSIDGPPPQYVSWNYFERFKFAALLCVFSLALMNLTNNGKCFSSGCF